REPLPAEVARIESLGVEFRMGEAIDTPDRLAALEAESDWIFLGVGLGSDVEIEYPGDDLPGVW
ncbi:MAG: NAD(P)-dependent oxidoreductase, partial [Gammaproteobacteria bacterium]|nr:NAD(P)-dependent oxidoreductase [Gemmatimonadota bacterium]NIU80371.1 NAD(P)-dependent oxidoreductase [Gammaproteobacteria bacterium]NIW32527.1 NAD(P)-dependent oxidoreductase [Actinomycetota bacterium]